MWKKYIKLWNVFKFMIYISNLPSQNLMVTDDGVYTPIGLKGSIESLETPNLQTNPWIIHLEINQIYNIGRDQTNSYDLINQQRPHKMHDNIISHPSWFPPSPLNVYKSILHFTLNISSKSPSKIIISKF